MKNFIKYITSMIADFLFPPKCIICKKYIENRSNIFCDECVNNILAVERKFEPIFPIKEIWRITKYRSGTRDILRKLKFNNDLSQIRFINKILNNVIDTQPQLTDFLKNIDIAIAVPLHAERFRERGFNQSECLFKDFLAHFDIKIEHFLIRTKATAHLYDLTPKERRAEIAGAFALSEFAKIAGKRILILDDIYTTGTTMSECARVLKSAGAAEIYGLALASDF